MNASYPDGPGGLGGGPAGSAYDPVLRTVARAVFYLVIVFALHLLLRGHHLPGGGFIAGLTTAIAIILHRVAFDADPFATDPRRLIPAGLGLAALTGIVPMLLGYPFLKSAYGYVTTPLTGEFEWATAVAFDVGVFLTVVGATLTIVRVLATAPDSDEAP